MLPRLRRRMTATVVVLLAAAAPLPALAAPKPDTPGRGQDVSWPQCSPTRTSPHTGPLPTDAAFGIVGTQDGHPNSANACLAEQWAWASARPQAPAFYLLPGNPGPAKTDTDGSGLSDAEHQRWSTGSLADPTKQPRPCDPTTTAGKNNCAYDYGWQAALNALANVDNAAIPVTAVDWWMDVEPASFYRTGSAAALAQNVVALQGTLDGLRSRPDRVKSVGIYAAPIGNWQAITGGDSTTFATLPYWYPVGSDGLASATAHCNQVSPAGGPVTQVQWTDTDEAIGKTFDQDVRCTAAPVVPTLRFTYVPTVVRTGATVHIEGTGLPGEELSVHTAEVGVPEHEALKVTVDSAGNFAADFVQHTNGYVTVFDSAGGINRKIQVSTGVGITKITAKPRTASGSCQVRLDGGVSPWLPGQIVQFLVGSKQIGFAHTRKRGDKGSFSATLKLACGKNVTVTPVLNGKAGKVTFAMTSRGTPRVLKPRG